jgi:hypothetical protein
VALLLVVNQYSISEFKSTGGEVVTTGEIGIDEIALTFVFEHEQQMLKTE